MSDIDSDLLFKGHTPGSISCEAFVRAVRKHAVDKNKARDDEYIADYAMSCLIDDALHWSEDLSREVQGDWPLLRRALLVEYGSSTRKSTSATPSLPSAMVPVPAAAPPLPAAAAQFSSTPPFGVSSSQSLRGHIKVVGLNVTHYLSKQLESGSGNLFNQRCLATENTSEACVLSGTMENGGLQFKFENLGPPFSHLEPYFGMVWLSDPNLDKEKNTLGAFSVVKVRGSTAISYMSYNWKGPVSWVTWVRAPDNTLTPKLEDLPEAGIAISGMRLIVASRIDGFVAALPDVWQRVRFVFEPL